MARASNGCAYGMVTREMVSDIKERIVRMDNKVTELFNHQSSKLPLWVTMLLAGLAGACGFLLKVVIGG